MKTASWAPSSGGSSEARKAKHLALLPGEERQAARAQRVEMRAARDQRHLVPGARESRRDQPAYRARRRRRRSSRGPAFGGQDEIRDRSRSGRRSSARARGRFPRNSTSFTRGPALLHPPGRWTPSSRSDSAPRSTRVGDFDRVPGLPQVDAEHEVAAEFDARVAAARMRADDRRVVGEHGTRRPRRGASRARRGGATARPSAGRTTRRSREGASSTVLQAREAPRRAGRDELQAHQRGPGDQRPDVVQHQAAGSASRTCAASIIPIRPPIEVPTQSIRLRHARPCRRRRRESGAAPRSPWRGAPPRPDRRTARTRSPPCARASRCRRGRPRPCTRRGSRAPRGRLGELVEIAAVARQAVQRTPRCAAPAGSPHSV